MDFFVIYSVDAWANDRHEGMRHPPFKRYHPRERRLWDRTEGRESYEMAYLEGAWARGNHGKWIARLTREQFDRFIDDAGLVAEDVQTMGSLTGFGHLPAVSFHGDDQDAILDAYVTPIPMVNGHEIENGTDRDWERVRRAVINTYS